jgi:NAD(P)-dependent dehydrogenase (short-subunit alcohol dehydrogenase family)
MLQNKRIVITGVGTGLGKEVARQCLQDGASITIGARTLANLEAVAAELDPSGERIEIVATDIGKVEDCNAIVARSVARFGGVDALIQVAAYEMAWGGVADADFNHWRKAFDVNVVACMELVRAARPAMIASGGGSVVLIGSQSMYEEQLPQMGYAASKGALQTAMFYLAKDLGPENIRVNMVVPSWMWGPPVQMYVEMTAKGEKVSADEVVARIAGNIPLGKIVPDEEVANAVAFFASDRARMISGQTLMVNGGEKVR